MNAKQAENLRVLADRIHGMQRALDMCQIASCGTPCCAFGEACVMPYFNAQGLSLPGENPGHGFTTEFHGRGVMFDEVSYILFGLLGDEHIGLFGTQGSNFWGHNSPANTKWAAKAREILAAHGYGPQSSEEWAKDKVAYVINSQDALIGTDKRDLLVTK